MLLETNSSTEAIGKPVSGVIAGGTGQFFGIRGTGTLTAGNMEGTIIPVKVVFIEGPTAATLKYCKIVIKLYL